MKRDQTLHERLIPFLVEGIGAKSYLELGTFENKTISRVKCEKRYGVDKKARPCAGVHIFNMSTQDFIQNWAKEYAPYDMVFIDANHSCLAVKDDFDGIWKYVADEGLVLLHDTNPDRRGDTDPGHCGDAWKFAEEISRVSESVTLPYHPGLTIVRKRKAWGPRS